MPLAAPCLLFSSLVPAARAGDFNGDGTDDIVIGVPGETLSGRANAGKIHIVYGSPGGASTSVTQPDRRGSSHHQCQWA